MITAELAIYPFLPFLGQDRGQSLFFGGGGTKSLEKKQKK